MNKKIYDVEKDGFYGVWYPCPNESQALVILMHKVCVGRMAEGPAKSLHEQGLHVLVLGPVPEYKKEFKEYPVDEIETAIHTLKKEGIKKFAIMGQSQTAMLSLIAASLLPEISLTAAFTPCDFVMEATKTTNGVERPIDASFAAWRGEALPFHRFAFRGDELTKRMKESGKQHGDLLRAREIFEESLQLNPLTEEQLIKVENIRGRVLVFGARDDAMWDTVSYIEKMEKRLAEHPHSCTFDKYIFEYGTHYVFPQGIIKRMLPASSLLIGLMFKNGKIHKKECRKTREEIESILFKAIKVWKADNKGFPADGRME